MAAIQPSPVKKSTRPPTAVQQTACAMPVTFGPSYGRVLLVVALRAVPAVGPARGVLLVLLRGAVRRLAVLLTVGLALLLAVLLARRTGLGLDWP